MLKEYPAARVRLEAIAVKRLEKYKRAPLQKGEIKKINQDMLHWLEGSEINLYHSQPVITVAAGLILTLGPKYLISAGKQNYRDIQMYN